MSPACRPVCRASGGVRMSWSPFGRLWRLSPVCRVYVGVESSGRTRTSGKDGRMLQHADVLAIGGATMPEAVMRWGSSTPVSPPVGPLSHVGHSLGIVAWVGLWWPLRPACPVAWVVLVCWCGAWLVLPRVAACRAVVTPSGCCWHLGPPSVVVAAASRLSWRVVGGVARHWAGAGTGCPVVVVTVPLGGTVVFPSPPNSVPPHPSTPFSRNGGVLCFGIFSTSGLSLL